MKTKRYYGDNGTIHSTTYVDVETYNGKVVSVWFRCCMLPFKQDEVNEERAREMRMINVDCEINAVELLVEQPDITKE